MNVTVCPSIVRRATPEDYQDIWRLFLMAHNENGLFSLSPHKVDYFLKRALAPNQILPGDNGPRGEVAVIGAVGQLEAICFVILGSFWYSDDMHLEELIVYVDPERRRSHHARELILWMKKAADEIGIPLFTGVMSTLRTEAKVRFYERFVPKIGAFFFYPLEKAKVHHELPPRRAA
jgi:hypothetical protein